MQNKIASDVGIFSVRHACPTDIKDMHCTKCSMQQGCLQHSQERDIAPGVLEKTPCQQGNDKILLDDFIESAAAFRAFRVLFEHNSFSQDALNKVLIPACQHGHKYIVQTLVRLGANVQYKDTNGNTPLLICAEKGFTDIVRFLLTKKADISTVNSAGDNALILSICSSGSTDMTRFLLQQRGININHQNRDGYTALMKAIEAMDIDTVEMLLVAYIKSNVPEASRGCVGVDFQWMLIDTTINCKGETAQQIADKTGLGDIFKLLRLHLGFGTSPLVLAVQTCDAESLSVLLDCQFSLPYDMRRSVNEAFVQIFEKCQMKNIKNFNDKEVAMVKKLLECGADMSTGWKGDINFDPVSIAVQAKCYTMVELLHKHGFKSKNMKLPSTVKGGNHEINGQILNDRATINPSTKDRVTPLVESKNRKVSKFQTQRDIDINRATEIKYGRNTHLIQTIMNGPANDPSTVKTIKGLLKKNRASVNGRSSDGRTPLMLAAVKEGSVNVLQMLLDHGANFCHSDREGDTALMNAIVGNCNTNVSFLIKFTKGNKNFLNFQNHRGFTALMFAALYGNITAMTELIGQGADINITDVNSNTALLHVLNKVPKPEKQFINFLVCAGSDVNCQNNDGFSPLMLAARRGMDDAISILLDSGADVNAVSNRDNTKTALSFLPYIPWLDESTRCCMESLLYRGASSSYMNPLVLHRIIFQGQIKVIPKLIQCGLGPVDVMFSEIAMIKIKTDMMCSPLCAALMTGHITLARYFMRNLFLTQFDVSQLLCQGNISRILKRHKHQECLDFLDEISSQPPSLFKLSFVAVLSAVGTSPGRENRVNMLPLLQIMKHKLLFKSQDIDLEVTALDKGTSNINSLQQLNNLLYDLADYS